MLWVILHLCLYVFISGEVCPEQSQTDIPKFTEELGGEDMVRFGHQIPILCCAEGYDNITWYRRQANDWIPYPTAKRGYSSQPLLLENRQVLQILSASQDDSTGFRCDLIKDGKIARQHVMELIVQSCDDLARGPIPTDPPPQNVTISELGENVTFHCTGYFGCGESTDGLVLWKVQKGGKYFDPSRYSNRYLTKPYGRHNNSIMGKSLRIIDVQAEDLKRTFFCVLSSSQIQQGRTTTTVQIFKKEKPPPRTPLLKVICITVGVVVGVLIIALVTIGVLKYLYGPTIGLYVRSRLPRCSCCNQAPERNVKVFYNGLLYHAEDTEDTWKAHEIRSQLKEKGYDVFMSDDISGNKSLSLYEEKTKQSLMIIFLYSNNLREDNFAHFLLQCLINDKRDRDIIFLVMDVYDPENIRRNTNEAVNPEQHSADGANEPALANNSSDACNDGNETHQASQESGLNKENKDLSFWKHLPKYKVPGENAAKRIKLNFISWLQNKIPKFKDQLEIPKQPQKERGSRRTSSSRRLLSNQVEEGLNQPSSVPVTDDEVFNIPAIVKVENGSPELVNDVSDEKNIETRAVVHNLKKPDDALMTVGETSPPVFDKITIDETLPTYDRMKIDNTEIKLDQGFKADHVTVIANNNKLVDRVAHSVDTQHEPTGLLSPTTTALQQHGFPFSDDESNRSPEASEMLTSMESSLSGSFNWDTASTRNQNGSQDHQNYVSPNGPMDIPNNVGSAHSLGDKANQTCLNVPDKLANNSSMTRKSSEESGYETGFSPEYKLSSPEFRENSVFTNQQF